MRKMQQAIMDINGIAHIQITVSRFELCVSFYEKLFELFGMKTVYRNDTIFYGVGARTGLAVTRCRDEYRGGRFGQRRIGLHHICSRARRREDIDAMYAFLQQINAKIVHPPEDGPWANPVTLLHVTCGVGLASALEFLEALGEFPQVADEVDLLVGSA